MKEFIKNILLVIVTIALTSIVCHQCMNVKPKEEKIELTEEDSITIDTLIKVDSVKVDTIKK